ncbi:MAG: hypothetical protein ACLQPH_08680 [Acidimicrobiales bacterium]
MSAVETSKSRNPRAQEGQDKTEVVPSSMAVSIVGFSTACSKDALVSSAKAVREALSTE